MACFIEPRRACRVLAFIILSIYFVPTKVIGQRKTFGARLSVDTIAGSIKEGVVQDRYIRIAYPLKDKVIHGVVRYRINADGLNIGMSRHEYRQFIIRPFYLKQTNGRKRFLLNLRMWLSSAKDNSLSLLKKLKAKYPYGPFMPILNYSTTVKKDSLIIISPPLSPNTQYEYLVFMDQADKEVETAFEIQNKADSGKIHEAKEIFVKKYGTYDEAFQVTYDGEGGFDDCIVSNPPVQKAFKAYKESKINFSKLVFPDILPVQPSTCFKAIVDLMMYDCKDCKVRYRGHIDSIDFFNRALLNLSSKPDSAFNNGYLPLTANVFDKQAKVNDYDQRAKNIETSINILRQIKSFSRLISVEHGNTAFCETLEVTIESNIKILNKTFDAIKVVLSLRKAYIKAITETGITILYEKKSPGLGTNIFDFKVRNGNIINACFGLVTYGSVYSGGNFSQFHRFWDIAPFAGVNINLRPIDKTLPFSQVPGKNLWYRTAIFTGITYNSLKDNSTREDFFGKSNLSLLLGASYRLTNAIRINYGALLFKRYATDPLQERKIITAAPFIGLNFDLDLRSLTGDITNVFK